MWKNRYESEKSGKNCGSVSTANPSLEAIASPATPLVSRPRDAFTGSLLFTYSARCRAHTRFCPPWAYPARLLTSQTWRNLPRFRLPITSPLIFSPPCPRKGDGTTADRTRSPLRSGPRIALELPVCAPLRLLLSSNGLAIQMLSSVLLPAINTHATVATAKHAAQNNPDGEHIALCSTPQGTTIQKCLGTHGRAATCRGIRALQTDSSSI
jgi:hypothetical protein